MKTILFEVRIIKFFIITKLNWYTRINLFVRRIPFREQRTQ